MLKNDTRKGSKGVRSLIYDFFVAVIIALLFNANYTYGLVESKSLFLQGQKSAAEKRAHFTCDIGQLSTEDSFNILKLLSDGFTGSEFGSNGKTREQDKLENPVVIIPLGKESGQAQKVELADQKFDLNSAIHLSDNWINGPYAFGIVLTDTLRVGRCVNLKDKNIPCPLAGKQLSLRNSGTGITGDFKNLWKVLKDSVPALKDKNQEDLTDEDYRHIREQLGLPESAEEDLKMRLAFTDVNDANIETYVRVPGKVIPNSILTYNFYAYGQTTCNSADCVISIYSLFDKYYNQWFSFDMTFSTVMPTLLGKGRLLFKHLGMSKVFPWRFSDSSIASYMRRKLYANPNSFFGRRLRARLKLRATQYPEVGKLRALLSEGQGWTKGYALLNPGTRDKLVKEWLAPDGWLRKIDDPITQRELYKFVKDLDIYTKTQADLIKHAEKRYSAIRKVYGFGSPAEIGARIDTGKVVSNVIIDYSDSMVIPDLPGWFARSSPTGLWTYSVKQKGATSPPWLAGDSTYMYDLLDKFRKDGHFAGSIYETTGRNLKLWRLEPAGRHIRDVTVEDLETNWYRYRDMFVKLDSGNVVPVADWSLPQIKKHATGSIPLYSEGKTLAAELSPEDFASKLLEERNLLNLKLFAPLNTDYMRHTLEAQGFMKRRYLSLLDRAISYQDKFFHNYMRPKGGIKWTALFNLYWIGKRGANQRWASAYMLPDTWREVRWPLGSSELYNDAFIDFFSHEGSDQGDMFNRMLQVMPWEFIAKNLFANFKPLQEIYNKLKNNQIRNTVENLAFYATTPESCESCGVSIRAGRDYSYFLSSFYSGRKLDAYILEDIVSEKAKKKGSTLITFTHHTDLEGKEQGVSGSTRISLEEAIRKKETCRDAVEKVTLGSLPKWMNPALIGGGLAFAENAGYWLFGFAGVFGSTFQQLVIAPKLQDCVDVDGGYYTHIFVPAPEEQSNKTEAANQLSTEAALNSIDAFANALTSMFVSDKNSYTTQAAEKLNSMVEQFVHGARQDNIVQANVHMEGSTVGTLEGEQLFSFWFKGETSPMKYKTSGHKIISSADKNTALLVDFNAGKIFLIDQNGNILDTIVDNNIASRLTSTNTNIPAEEIPKRYTLVGLPDSNEPLFEMNIDSELFVLVPEVSDCILQGIEYQIGVPYENPNRERLNLEPVFGKVLSINTDMYSIHALNDQKRIVAEGTPRRMVEGENAKVIIQANRNTALTNSVRKEAGLLESIIFENGVIIYKPDTHELIIWLKRSKAVDVPQDFIGGIRLKPEEVINPETMCPEPAFSIEALPSASGGYEAYKVNSFNQALQNAGPFTVLETPTRRFIFFSRYEPDGKCVGIECCKDYIRIINKETGEVYEAPIESFEVTPEGIHIKDANGREHNIGVTAEDGRPMVVYNNYPPEPLVSAQGPNGSFWYDPEKGMWHVENAQLLPLLEAFRSGALTQATPGGQIITKPGDNIMNIQAGLGGGPFNLPSLPEQPLLLIIYIGLLVLSFVSVRIYFIKKRC
ncbi:MAG: hypothetical protein J7J87_00325 [Candidatus Diapherotrites archaeon]|nr:hypothetical protein [Candidatus Diapherotrites archaeon]